MNIKEARKKLMENPDFAKSYGQYELPMRIGFQIQRLRKAKGWSQSRLAAEMDTGQSRISALENGLRMPDVSTLMKASEVLGVELVVELSESQLTRIVEDKKLNIVEWVCYDLKYLFILAAWLAIWMVFAGKMGWLEVVCR